MVIIENYCLLCNQPLAIAAHGICGFCERGLPEMPPVCRRCGLPLVTPEPECGRCLQSPPPWQSLLAVTGYQPPLAALVHRLKYSGQTHIARALARLLLRQVLAAYRARNVRSRICCSASRFTVTGNGGAGLIRVILSPFRWQNGCAALMTVPALSAPVLH